MLWPRLDAGQDTPHLPAIFPTAVLLGYFLGAEDHQTPKLWLDRWSGSAMRWCSDRNTLAG